MNIESFDGPSTTSQSYDKHTKTYEKEAEKKFDPLLLKQERDFYARTLGFKYQTDISDFFKPIISGFQGSRWLTVGDGGYGSEAQYIAACDPTAKIIATDIDTSLLERAHELQLIKNFERQNAEALTYADNSFDFTLCKNSYHHFPRPMIALYEMIRVSSKGVILLEPDDSIIERNSVMRIFWDSVANIIRPGRKERLYARYETVGNFIYSISERELEKVALGLNLPAIAVRRFNDRFVDGIEHVLVGERHKLATKLKLQSWLFEALNFLNIIPYNGICLVILKQNPPENLKNVLRTTRFKVKDLPRNPYLIAAS